MRWRLHARLSAFEPHACSATSCFAQGLLIATGVPGVYGRSGEFEDTSTRIDRLVAAARRGGRRRGDALPSDPEPRRTSSAADTSTRFRTSPAPFTASPAASARTASSCGPSRTGRRLERGLPAAAVVLTPAACYPVYPALAGTLPAGGRLVDVMSYCFRHEPSDDAGRMQMFRMHEHVRAADAETVVAWRERWLGRVQSLAEALGLDARVEVASDPFFGRGGKLLAVSQRDQRLKFEIVAPIASDEQPTAIISLNYHQDHFGALFGITTADGAVAHTSCIGFGLERLALALYRRHGFDRAALAVAGARGAGL